MWKLRLGVVAWGAVRSGTESYGMVRQSGFGIVRKGGVRCVVAWQMCHDDAGFAKLSFGRFWLGSYGDARRVLVCSCEVWFGS